jgi:hypothetical protein
VTRFESDVGRRSDFWPLGSASSKINEGAAATR